MRVVFYATLVMIALVGTASSNEMQRASNQIILGASISNPLPGFRYHSKSKVAPGKEIRIYSQAFEENVTILLYSVYKKRIASKGYIIYSPSKYECQQKIILYVEAMQKQDGRKWSLSLRQENNTQEYSLLSGDNFRKIFCFYRNEIWNISITENLKSVFAN
jgi:hypothetical protein